jgi:hypothetical protein
MESNHHREPWNKVKSVGQNAHQAAIQKPPLASVGVAPII